MLVQEYIVDFSSNNNFFLVKSVQGDNNRYVRLKLSNYGQPYSIASDDAMYATIRGTKPDNKEVWNYCDIIDDSTIQFELTSQMTAVAGKSDYEISILRTDNNKVITSFPFFIIVSKSSIDVDYIKSSNEFNILVDKIQQSTAATTDCINSTNTCKELTQTMDALETTVSVNENVRIGNETSRKNSETERINAERDRRKVENERVSAENIRYTNELLRMLEEEQRQENTENAIKLINNTVKIVEDLVDTVENKIEINDNLTSQTTTWSSSKIKGELDNLHSIKSDVDTIKTNYVTTTQLNSIKKDLTDLSNTTPKRFTSTIEPNGELILEVNSYAIIYTQTNISGTGIFTKIGTNIVQQGNNENLICECLSETSIKFTSTNENNIDIVVLSF